MQKHVGTLYVCVCVSCALPRDSVTDLRYGHCDPTQEQQLELCAAHTLSLSYYIRSHQHNRAAWPSCLMLAPQFSWHLVRLFTLRSRHSSIGYQTTQLSCDTRPGFLLSPWAACFTLHPSVSALRPIWTPVNLFAFHSQTVHSLCICWPVCVYVCGARCLSHTRHCICAI